MWKSVKGFIWRRYMMDERKDNVLEMTNEEYRGNSQDYGKLIIEMVHNISDRWILLQIYRCIKNITKEG